MEKAKFKKFVDIINTNNYIFHIHTDLTDGKSSLDDYYNRFKGKNLIFTEHIRKNVQYDYEKFIQKAHSYNFLAGFEAKILPNRDLDILDAAIKKADVIAIAVHSYKADPDTLIESLRNSFEHYKNTLPLVWVHPYTSKIEKNNFSNKLDYIRKVLKGYEDQIFIEYNLSKKNFTPLELKLIRKNYKLIYGYDAHSVQFILSISPSKDSQT